MHQGQGGDATGVRQVGEVLTHLVGQEQALVNDGPGGQGRNIELATVVQLELAHRMFDPLADHEQLAFKAILVGHIGALADEDLAHHGLGILGGLSQALVVPGHIPPAQENLSFFVDNPGDSGFAGQPTVVGLGQEDVAAGVTAELRQADAQLGRLRTQQGVGQLQQNPGPVPQQGVVTGRATVIQIFQDLQTLFNDPVALLVFDMGHETDAASVLFVDRIVQALPFGDGPTWDNTIHHARVLVQKCRPHGHGGGKKAGAWTPAFIVTNLKGNCGL